MDIDLIFKIAAVGIIVSILNQVLVRSGREEQATMTTLAGLVVVLMIVVQRIAELFDLVKTLTDGGPFFKTDVIALYIYRYAFSSTMGVPRLGYASSAAMVFGAITIVIALIVSGAAGAVKKLTQV